MSWSGVAGMWDGERAWEASVSVEMLASGECEQLSGKLVDSPFVYSLFTVGYKLIALASGAQRRRPTSEAVIQTNINLLSLP